MFFKIIVCFFLAYFLGTVQTAIILSNQVAKQDIRNFGSGNAGSTNMIRTFGWGLGALTFLGDLLKGALAFIIGNWIGGPVCAAIGGVMVVVGHNWPVQHSFRGGKGIAATFGVMLACNPIATLIVFAVCLVVALVTRFVSLASLLGITAFFFINLFSGSWAYIVMSTILLLMGFFTHRENIKRLLAGEENPFFGAKKNPSAAPQSKAQPTGKRNLK